MASTEEITSSKHRATRLQLSTKIKIPFYGCGQDISPDLPRMMELTLPETFRVDLVHLNT